MSKHCFKQLSLPPVLFSHQACAVRAIINFYLRYKLIKDSTQEWIVTSCLWRFPRQPVPKSSTFLAFILQSNSRTMSCYRPMLKAIQCSDSKNSSKITMQLSIYSKTVWEWHVEVIPYHCVGLNPCFLGLVVFVLWNWMQLCLLYMFRIVVSSLWLFL